MASKFDSLFDGGADMGKRLTAAFVKQAAPGRHYDENGLMLLVRPSGSRQWVQRLTISGKRRDIGLGGYPIVTLAEARKAALENRMALYHGADILGERRRVHAERRGIPTFAEASEATLALAMQGWKDGGKSAELWRASLNVHALPKIGALRVDRITASDISAILEPIWRDRRATARKVKQRMGRIMDWAVAHGHRSDNPVTAAGSVLPKGGAKATHLRAVPWRDLPGALDTIRATSAWHSTKLALEFLALTATRSGEVRSAEWSEVDIQAGLWTIPGERTKTGREFRVPLSAQSLAVLEVARQHDDGSGLVFPSIRGRDLSDNTLSKLMRENGVPGVPHGFRSAFRDWCSEATEAPREVAEAALAHVVVNPVEAAYARSDLLDKRRPLMQQWGDHLTTGSKG